MTKYEISCMSKSNGATSLIKPINLKVVRVCLNSHLADCQKTWPQQESCQLKQRKVLQQGNLVQSVARDAA